MEDKVGLAALVATREVDAVFFFEDPLSAQPHDPDMMTSLAEQRAGRREAWATPD